ncbi:TRAP transporter large permease [Hoeflea prorocentri]|uniref:TRAP transporter large permease n=1 Tax=Hoeflea prorocentri TaxID=1922333 RepID=A0A9X3UHM4_9HYPH|nr:TRAP transporter large permease [Hoeflea prorocentri]MCY6379398.1 TRAP transporter large permease [Hoeflea prorocentri]MDA5397199.1 TRAP transporter large permease [Hoeflea prorocentri]
MTDLDTSTLGLLSVVFLMALVAGGIRIFVAAALVGFLGLASLRGWDAAIGLAGLTPYAKAASYQFSVLPMFILIGFLAFHAGLTRNVFEAARIWVGRLPGGLAVATILATAGFSAVSGASTATSAVFSRIALPEMLGRGYKVAISAGVVAAGGTLASLIPPSGILVIYGIIAETSIGKLLIAGFVPGFLSAAIYVLLLVFLFKRNPGLGPAGTAFPLREKIASIRKVSGIAVVIMIVLGGLYTGLLTPTETGAAGAFVMLLFCVFRADFKLENMAHAFMETVKVSSMIFAVIWAVLIYVRFLGFTGLPNDIAAYVLSFDVNRYVILIAILLFYVVLGMFMDAIGMLLLTLPIVIPTIIGLGFNEIWFGIILVKMAEICLITPPIGLNCFVVHGVRPDIPMNKIFQGAAPFFVADVATVGLLIAVPEIVLWLPNQMAN